MYDPFIGVTFDEASVGIGFSGLGFNFNIAKLLFLETHLGLLGESTGLRTSLGITLERFMENFPVTVSFGSDGYIATDLDGSENSTYWAGFAAKIEYHIGGKIKSQSRGGRGGGGPSAPNERPSEKTGNAKIDDFITKTYDLNDKIIDLKKKVVSVADGLSEANTVLSDIGDHPKGPFGWSFTEIQKGFSKSANSIKAAAGQINSDRKDLPVAYVKLFGETVVDSTFQDSLIEGIKGGKVKSELDIQRAFVQAFNKKARIQGLPLTSAEWIKSLNLELDPTKTLKNKLGKINDGIIGGKDKLASIPSDLKDLGTQAQSLLSSATELPAEAKNLGFKAPAALKIIKSTTGVLKNIPNEVSTIGNEANKILVEIDQVLKNIKAILN